MLNYEGLKENYKILSENTETVRRELTILGGLLAEDRSFANLDDYIKFMNELSIDEFVGKFMISLFASGDVELVKTVPNGINDLVDTLLTKELQTKYYSLV